MGFKNLKLANPDASPADAEPIGASAAFARNPIDEDRKSEVKYMAQHPVEKNPVIKALSKDKDEAILKILPQISSEQEIDRSKIIPAPDTWNFFGKPDAESYSILLNSIIRDGLFNPITVWEQKDGTYMILSGHTRESCFDELAQATNDPKYNKIPCRIYANDMLNDDAARRIIIVANFAQRAKESLRVRMRCYIELARLTKKSADYGSGIDVASIVAKIFNVSRATVFFYTSLSRLIDPIFDAFDKGDITRREVAVLATMPVKMQKYIVANRLLGELSTTRLKALKKAESVEDIEDIFRAPEVAPQHTYQYKVKLAIEKPKNADILPLCINHDDIEDVKNTIRDAILRSGFEQKIKDNILAQL